ncbi:hypothetical protein [Pseudarthrobacter sp. H2]|uniref:hypothetical protein n=1 Tax=Pseudarthrobacter sp. H2 TaxID=3418415 RepID=UPI003CF172D2
MTAQLAESEGNEVDVWVRRNFLERTGTEGRLYLDNPFGLLEEDSVLEEYHFGQDTIYHKVKGENHFVRMGEHFVDSLLNGTPLRYDLTDAAKNAPVLEALDEAARKQEGENPVGGPVVPSLRTTTLLAPALSRECWQPPELVLLQNEAPPTMATRLERRRPD